MTLQKMNANDIKLFQQQVTHSMLEKRNDSSSIAQSPKVVRSSPTTTRKKKLGASKIQNCLHSITDASSRCPSSSEVDHEHSHSVKVPMISPVDNLLLTPLQNKNIFNAGKLELRLDPLPNVRTSLTKSVANLYLDENKENTTPEKMFNPCRSFKNRRIEGAVRNLNKIPTSNDVERFKDLILSPCKTPESVLKGSPQHLNDAPSPTSCPDMISPTPNKNTTHQIPAASQQKLPQRKLEFSLHTK